MVKILHTADVHLGAKFAVLGERAEAYRQQLKKTFAKIIDLALTKKVGLFLVAGDLFDANFPAATTISFVKSEFKRLAEKDILVVILPGTHDCLNSESIYWREDFGKNVFVFQQAGSHVVLELDLTVWAKPNMANQSSESPLDFGDIERGNKSGEKTKYNIALAHGSVIGLAAKVDEQQFPMTKEAIVSSKFDYIALGHWHSLRQAKELAGKACYPGSPEPLNFSQTDAGYVALVELIETGVKVETVKVGVIEFDELTIDLGLYESLEEIKAIILKGFSGNLCRQVKLQGIVGANLAVDWQEIETELDEKFFRLKIVDNAQGLVDSAEADASQYPSELVIGQFNQLMQEKIKTATDEKQKRIISLAAKMGLAALQNSGFQF